MIAQIVGAGCPQWYYCKASLFLLFLSRAKMRNLQGGYFVENMASQLSWNHYHKWGRFRNYKALELSAANVNISGHGRKNRALSSSFGTLFSAYGTKHSNHLPID